MLKRSLFIITFCALLSGLMQAQKPAGGYDKALADSLGADEYGMKMYFFVILKTGPGKIENEEEVNKLFSGHMANISRLVNLNKLIVAGPFGKNDKTYRGLFIFNNCTEPELKELLQSDPAVKAKLLEPEIYNWYGSAALPVYLKTADKITKGTF